MDFPTKVNIVLCILSFALAAISVVTVVITLRQNNKMIENATRPYITVYLNAAYLNEDNVTGYFIVKNFGNSSGRIETFEHSNNILLENSSNNHVVQVLKNLPGITLSPNQKYLIPFNFEKICSDKVTFRISYAYEKKTYYENVDIPLDQFKNFVSFKVNSDAPLHMISRSLHSINEKLF